MIKIIETPRDAFQGIAHFIPTERKISYINGLLTLGFDTVEVGSFVSPTAIPQMRDTAEVIKGLNLNTHHPRIMVLAGNTKGVEMACRFDEINDIAYPFSASPVFLKKNINRTQSDALRDIEASLDHCAINNKQLIVYLTMAFGNPYSDEWSVDLVLQLVSTLKQMGVRCIPLSDITGEANEQILTDVFHELYSTFPDIEFGLHLHSEKDNAFQKVKAAWKAGCRRFDTVIGGLGGCPMTGKELIANLDTRTLLDFLASQSIPTDVKIPLNHTSIVI